MDEAEVQLGVSAVPPESPRSCTSPSGFVFSGTTMHAS